MKKSNIFVLWGIHQITISISVQKTTFVKKKNERFQAKMKASEDSSFAREVEQEKVKKAQEEEDAKNKQEAFNEIKAKFCTA